LLLADSDTTAQIGFGIIFCWSSHREQVVSFMLLLLKDAGIAVGVSFSLFRQRYHFVVL